MIHSLNEQSLGTAHLRADMHTQGTTFLGPQEQAAHHGQSIPASNTPTRGANQENMLLVSHDATEISGGAGGAATGAEATATGAKDKP